MRRFVAWFVGGASVLALTITAGMAGASGPLPDNSMPRMDEPADPPAPQDGPGIYKASCNKCHGPDGMGKTKIGDKHRAEGKKMPDLTTSKMEIDKIVEVVTNGVEKTSMKGYKDKLTAAQIAEVAKYARAFRK